jgi:hypothetical protein
MKKLALLLGAIPLCAFASPAGAVLQIAIDVNGNVFTCSDNQSSGCDADPATGTLELANDNLFGLVQVTGSFSVGTTNGLTISTFNIINLSGAPLNYEAVVSDTDYAGPVAAVNWSGSGTWYGGSGTAFEYQWYADAANGQGAGSSLATPGTLLGTYVSTVGSSLPASFAKDGSTPFSASGPYSLTMVWGSGTSFPGTTGLASDAYLVGRNQAETGVIPEPSTWAMMGLGFALIGGVGWRRSRRPVADLV